MYIYIYVFFLDLFVKLFIHLFIHSHSYIRISIYTYIQMPEYVIHIYIYVNTYTYSLISGPLLLLLLSRLWDTGIRASTARRAADPAAGGLGGLPCCSGLGVSSQKRLLEKWDTVGSYLYIYTYICMCMYIYIHISIYIYTCRER